MNRHDEVLIALRRIIRATDLHSRQLSKTSGLTAPQLLILQTLERNQNMTIGAIAQQISLSQATVTTIIDRLESRGMVQRERDLQDRRRVHVRLTASAHEALQHAPTPLQESFVQQFRQLQNWEQSMILSALERVACMMDAQGIDASPVLDVGAIDRHNDTVGNSGPVTFTEPTGLP